MYQNMPLARARSSTFWVTSLRFAIGSVVGRLEPAPEGSRAPAPSQPKSERPVTVSTQPPPDKDRLAATRPPAEPPRAPAAPAESDQPVLLSPAAKHLVEEASLDPTQVGGFKTAAELSLLDPKGNVIWDDIAGDPEHYVFAKSPFMVESSAPRTNLPPDPITGAAISPPSTPNQMGSSVGGEVLNDHERTLPGSPPVDIQYACIFDLPSGQEIDGSSILSPGSATWT